ncbi:MAG: glycosyltransferase [Dehalococcoidia bacterium]|nr:glycosyltransferase [Dehalococcoidia bacterium]MDD5493660.1 glycosyltransferase [Dehalococcoidia bacterium]
MQQDLLFNILSYIQTVIILVLTWFLIVSLTNLRYLRRLHSYPSVKISPRFSVLVPARNEEDNIGKCVSSLLAQDYPDFQVMVLDDNSTDRTWEILQELSLKDRRLTILKGKPLPDDWLGKHWACHQLALASDGELLLFVDADTWSQPDMLRCAVAALVGEDAALVSALPRQFIGSWSEILSIPAFYLGMLSGVPLGLTRLQRNPLLFSVLGQFLMFKRSTYEAVGGYASVRQNIVDDIAIGRKVHSMGMAYRLLDGNGQISCRMYRNFNQVWKGLTKSTFASFNFDPFFLIFMWIVVLAIFVEPWIMLGFGLAQPDLPFEITAQAAMAVFLSLLLFTASNHRFNFPLYYVFLSPISALFMTAVALASMVLTMQGKARWKDRNMPKTVRP